MAIVKHPAGGNVADLRDDSNDEADKYLKKAGYARGGRAKHPDEAEDKKLIAKMIHKEEKEEGKKETKFKKGGKVEGKKAEKRLDKFARGGHVKGKQGGNKVNIVIAPGAGGPQRPPVAPGGMLPPGGAPAVPPMAGRPAGGPPPAPNAMPPRPMPPAGGMPGGAPGAGPMPPPMARGGKVQLRIEGGSRGGIGRLEKIQSEKRLIHKKDKAVATID